MIPYNRPHVTGQELDCIAEAIGNIHLSANGPFTERCQLRLQEKLGAARVLLTHSCSAALEMATLLAGVGPGDEVILPSFTFSSTANAVVLRGATPVFVDIRPDTLNLNEHRIDAAVTPRTRAITVVHYAGVGADMTAIEAIARRRGLSVLEDAAHGLCASHDGRQLGTMGAMGALSFHETKNVISGEGGALILNDPALVEAAEVAWEKGSDRGRFRRGEIDRYTWQAVGSSFAPSEIVAAFLWPQLQSAERMTRRRIELWRSYHEAFAALEAEGAVRRPVVPASSAHNGHLYYLLLADAGRRAEALEQITAAGVTAVFHYVPLHSSPAGRRYGRVSGEMGVTDDVAARLIRLPMHFDLSSAEQAYVIEVVSRVCRALQRA